MKNLALIAALVSTAAIAQADDHHADARVEHRYRDAVPLAAMDISNKQTIDLPHQTRPFRALRIQALRGAAYVDFVEVRFGNGEQQHVDVQRRIGRGETAEIDTGGRHLQAITVHGTPDRWSRIQVVGLR